MEEYNKEVVEYLVNENRRKLSLAYKALFDGAESEIVLEDLMAFCRANESSYVPGDPHSTAFCEGRREVYLHIQKYISMGVD